jgi:hypothetical protein
MIDQAIGRLTAAIAEMADGMIALARSAESEPVKLNAQKSVMIHLRELVDQAETRERLERIENRLAEVDKNKPRIVIPGTLGAHVSREGNDDDTS